MVPKFSPGQIVSYWGRATTVLHHSVDSTGFRYELTGTNGHRYRAIPEASLVDRKAWLEARVSECRAELKKMKHG